jgi:molybdenum cofactor cytidylyltransferase
VLPKILHIGHERKKERNVQAIAILPAAGQSRRMGQPKLLLPWGNSTILGATIRAWQGSLVDKIVVVTRMDDQPLREHLASFNVDVVLLPNATADMKATLQAGLDWARKQFKCCDADIWLTAPADLPMLTSETINTVFAAYDPVIPLPVIAQIEGKAAHPVLLPFDMADIARRCGPHEGLRDFLARESAKFVSLPPGTMQRSVNTWEDYKRLCPKTMTS